MLTTTDHSRDSAGLRYVYPVVSRRAGGVSIGINLNPNNACNWRCIYCQVPNLSRGSAPAIDLTLLRQELTGLLEDLLGGDFYHRFGVEPVYRSVRDIALSGNGEPTSAREFEQVIALIGEVVTEAGLAGRIKLVLISNGSLMQQRRVQQGLRHLAELGGEVWFKVDSVLDAGIQRINHAALTAARLRENLEIASRLCPTWLQTCCFALDGQPPSDEETGAYLAFLESLIENRVPLEGVLLYGLARQPQQPERARLSALPAVWLENHGAAVRRLGLDVRVSA